VVNFPPLQIFPLVKRPGAHSMRGRVSPELVWTFRRKEKYFFTAGNRTPDDFRACVRVCVCVCVRERERYTRNRQLSFSCFKTLVAKFRVGRGGKVTRILNPRYWAEVSYVAHETAISHNPTIYSFRGDREKSDRPLTHQRLIASCFYGNVRRSNFFLWAQDF
jgi:hypothetical protein